MAGLKRLPRSFPFGLRLAAMMSLSTDVQQHPLQRERNIKGVKLVILPTIGTKHLDTVFHTFLSVFHAIPRRFDAVAYLQCGKCDFCGSSPRLPELLSL